MWCRAARNLVAGVAFCGLLLRVYYVTYKTRLRKRVADVPRLRCLP